MSLPTDLLPPNAIKGAQVDPRCLFEHYNQLSVSYNSLFAQKMALQDDVHHLRNDVTTLRRSNERLEKVVTQQSELLSRVVEVLEIKHVKQRPSPQPNKPTKNTPLFFTDSVKSLRKDATIQELFVAFFYRRCMEGYQLELKSPKYKAKLKSEQNSIKGQYKRLKKVVKVMLFFCDSYPPPPPENLEEFNSWHKKLTHTAEQCANELITTLTEEESLLPKRITQAYIQKSPVVAAWDNQHSPKAKHAPPNTPQSALTHFGFTPHK